LYYSVTFDDKNTWDDWRLIPTSPPMVAPPKVYENYVEIPGRVLGPIDLSEALSGCPTYNNSEGEWEFIYHPDLAGAGYDRQAIYDEIRSYLHHKSRRIYLDEDNAHYYVGRLEVAAPKANNSGCNFTIKYKIQPVRYNLNGSLDTSYP